MWFEQDRFLQKKGKVCVSNGFVIEDSKFSRMVFLLWKMSE